MGRRRNKKRRPTANKTPAPPPAPPSPSRSQQIHWWRRILHWKWAVLVFVATVVTLAEGYPWLSIEEGWMLDPHNPLSEMFRVVNGGYLPVTNLDAICETTFTNANHISFYDNRFRFDNFADYLAHDGSATIPCFRGINSRPMETGTTLDITINYSLYHINFSLLRRSQKFRFRSVTDKAGSHHWIFLS